MKLDVLDSLVKQGKSQREIADELRFSQSAIRHWLKKYGLNTCKRKKAQDESGLFKCPKCKTNKNANEFYRRGGSGERSNELSGYCKQCDNKYTRKRLIDIKFKMIEYKGGKCIKCPLTLEASHYAVFEFHHRNPELKDPRFNRIKYQSWKKIKNEIDKCDLVCANCHRIIHAEIRESVPIV